jgi:2-hydroxyacyl-CoA lyase 1
MVVGDSAFGFSGMEIETACRYNLPLKVIIINNNGITFGSETKNKDDDAHNLPVTHLNPESKYEMIAQAFGGKGAEVKDHKTLEQTLDVALGDNNLWIVNVRIDPSAGRKPQQFSWLTRDDNKKKEDPKL